MKKFLAIATVLGTTMALGACNGNMGYVDTAPPYTQERTQGTAPTAAATAAVTKAAPVRYKAAERTFSKVQSK